MHVTISTLAIIAAIALLCAIIAAACSRHKKSGTRNIKLIGAVGITETRLDPEGTVLIDGELWHARSLSGVAVRPRHRVSVISLDDHVVLVELIPDRA